MLCILQNRPLFYTLWVKIWKLGIWVPVLTNQVIMVTRNCKIQVGITWFQFWISLCFDLVKHLRYLTVFHAKKCIRYAIFCGRWKIYLSLVSYKRTIFYWKIILFQPFRISLMLSSFLELAKWTNAQLSNLYTFKVLERLIDLGLPSVKYPFSRFKTFERERNLIFPRLF